jgi:hypothetical protein
MVDNYTHFESLHKQHPDLAVPVFDEVEKLRNVLDTFRLTVALRLAKQLSALSEPQLPETPPDEVEEPIPELEPVVLPEEDPRATDIQVSLLELHLAENAPEPEEEELDTEPEQESPSKSPVQEALAEA